MKTILHRLTRDDAQTQSTYLDVHIKSQLEVVDPKHRYDKFLREYHKEWNRMGQPERDFFAWLDRTPVDLQHVPISVLNAETVSASKRTTLKLGM